MRAQAQDGVRLCRFRSLCSQRESVLESGLCLDGSTLPCAGDWGSPDAVDLETVGGRGQSGVWAGGASLRQGPVCAPVAWERLRFLFGQNQSQLAVPQATYFWLYNSE